MSPTRPDPYGIWKPAKPPASVRALTWVYLASCAFLAGYAVALTLHRIARAAGLGV
jgi:hypothetical protein